MVLLQQPDGSTILVPVSEEGQENQRTYKKRSGKSRDAIDLAIGIDPSREYPMQSAKDYYKEPSREQMVQRIEKAGRNISDVADQGYDERTAREDYYRQQARGAIDRGAAAVQGATPTPFTDVRRGISEDVIRQNPSQSDILEKSDLALRDYLRAKSLGVEDEMRDRLEQSRESLKQRALENGRPVRLKNPKGVLGVRG